MNKKETKHLICTTQNCVHYNESQENNCNILCDVPLQLETCCSFFKEKQEAAHE